MAGNGNGNGNPFPGYPHDTIMIHVHPDNGNPINCEDGGHALHLRANASSGGIYPVNISYTMRDWWDENGNGTFDQDNPKEVGGDTKATDCDGSDGTISIQIRDTNGTKNVVSTQNWSLRLVGKPYQKFNFTSWANHTVSCTSVDDGPDLTPGTDDDTYECNYNYVNLGYSDLSGSMKSTGKGFKGKTSFEDITEFFLVDVQLADDSWLYGKHIFSVSCADNATTTEINETFEVCPLGSAIWDVDKDTQRPKIQLFVSHTGWAPIVGGKKICNPKKGC
jgi:hypothetical protein